MECVGPASPRFWQRGNARFMPIAEVGSVMALSLAGGIAEVKTFGRPRTSRKVSQSIMISAQGRGDVLEPVHNMA